MDRIFLFNRDYFEDDTILDAKAYHSIAKRWAPRCLDTVETISSDAELDTWFAYAQENALKAVPIGDIPFIERALESASKLQNMKAIPRMKPIELPSSLRPFAQREYVIRSGADIIESGECFDANIWFMKDATHLKRWNSAIQEGNLSRFVDKNTDYVISRKVIFTSEYRIFANNGKIEAVQRYLGDPLCFPDGNTIQNMISAYTQEPHPGAYTLDVGIIAPIVEWEHQPYIAFPSNDEYIGYGLTVPIEVHPFCACGLYGFYDTVLLDMLEAGWDWYIGGAGK